MDGMAPPTIDADIMAFVLTRLLRPGEEAARAWPLSMRRDDYAQASWWQFVEERYRQWDGLFGLRWLPNIRGIPIGWTCAAVRVYGSGAPDVLWEFWRKDWPGGEEAERVLRDRGQGVVRERRPWERT